MGGRSLVLFIALKRMGSQPSGRKGWSPEGSLCLAWGHPLTPLFFHPAIFWHGCSCRMVGRG